MTPSNFEKTTPTSLATRLRNLVIVTIAIALAILVLVGVRTTTPAASLETLAETAVPLEVALASDRPSLVEFYANWCTSCQAMSGDMAALKDEYGDRVNFVMLNVDNTKWLPEMLAYRVDGIPHFVYLDEAGTAVGMAIGEQPKTVLASNLDALLNHADLPYQQSLGVASNLPGTDEGLSRSAVIQNRSDNPRSHGAQASN